MRLGLKQELYGRYTCVFEYRGTGRVEWNVYLNVAPILILPLIPPPPPLLESGLENPRCLQGSAAANLTEQWRHACEVLAYPPVAPSHHMWNWSNAENAITVIRSTLVQQSPQAMMVFDQLLRLAEDEQRDSRDCLGLLVPQNASVSVGKPTLFWCYAKNEIGVSGARWPQDYDAPELPSWAVWLLVLQALGMAVAATVAWCRCCHHSHRRRNLLDRVLRWVSSRLPPFASFTGDWGLVAVGLDDSGCGNASHRH
ncbi:unnamed protein product [Taenia asiatica]|uniref:Ig-like domain-containing protein n=1 Tax=Taenia asiatica TaxID=60517 RepID=A0A0R3WCK0_TAEAS|nr:unnamed protein product [Taenia asiatica]